MKCNVYVSEYSGVCVCVSVFESLCASVLFIICVPCTFSIQHLGIMDLGAKHYLLIPPPLKRKRKQRGVGRGGGG